MKNTVCERMAPIDEAREQIANSFKELNHIEDGDWQLLIAYADQACIGGDDEE